MRLLFTLGIFCLATFTTQSQSIQYHYDEAGNRFRRVYDGGALPVTLVRFSAVQSESSALLEWQTASEVNASHFDLEHSTTAGPWRTLDRITARGSEHRSHDYRYRDDAPAGGLNLYRLKIVDQDGSFSYSKLESLSFALDFALYPNPVPDFLQLSEKEGITSLDVLSANGSSILQTDRLPDKGLDFRSYPPGVYVVKIHRRDGSVTTHKIIRP